MIAFICVFCSIITFFLPRFLLSGSGDDNCYVFDVNDPSRPPWVLQGHVGEVTSVAWCPSDLGKVAFAISFSF